jgi:hypothetical protein
LTSYITAESNKPFINDDDTPIDVTGYIEMEPVQATNKNNIPTTDECTKAIKDGGNNIPAVNEEPTPTKPEESNSNVLDMAAEKEAHKAKLVAGFTETQKIVETAQEKIAKMKAKKEGK